MQPSLTRRSTSAAPKEVATREARAARRPTRASPAPAPDRAHRLGDMPRRRQQRQRLRRPPRSGRIRLRCLRDDDRARRRRSPDESGARQISWRTCRAATSSRSACNSIACAAPSERSGPRRFPGDARLRRIVRRATPTCRQARHAGVGAPEPRDAIATTLVMRAQLARPAIREVLSSGVTSTTARGGISRRAQPASLAIDACCCPWLRWYVLARPTDLGDLTRRSERRPRRAARSSVRCPRGSRNPIDRGRIGRRRSRSRARAHRGWRAAAQSCRGAGRVRLPNLGLGVTSSRPTALSLAMELVPLARPRRRRVRDEADATRARQASADHVQQASSEAGYCPRCSPGGACSTS